MSYGLIYSAKQGDGILKINQILTHDGCFSFHRVENAQESGLCPDCVSLQ